VKSIRTSRRDYLKALTAGTLLAGTACKQQTPAEPAAAKGPAIASAGPPPDHDRRIQWWRDSKFGMFIHWGLYSLLGRQEWVMAVEDIPVREYEKLAQQFKPQPNAARAWARLARQTG
jgi:alpha-L-fucosidase